MSEPIIDNYSSVEARAKRIRFVRENILNITRGDLCKDSSISEPSLKSWELANAGGLTEKGANKLEKRFKEIGLRCSALWLLHGIGYAPIRNPEHLNISDSEEQQIARELLEFRKQTNAVDILVEDDSMIPLLYPGDYVAGIVVQKIENAIDKVCIIKTGDQNMLIRKLNHGTEPGRYNISCLNKNPTLAKTEIYNVQITLAAPVIWIRRKNPEQ